MKMDDEQSYYLKRAEAELALAQAATHPKAVKAHYHLAGFYLDRAYSDQEAATTVAATIAPQQSEVADYAVNELGSGSPFTIGMVHASP